MCKYSSNEEKIEQKQVTGQRYKIELCFFANQGAIECIVGFRIDSRTAKRGNLSYLVPLSVSFICICTTLSDVVSSKRKCFGKHIEKC